MNNRNVHPIIKELHSARLKKKLSLARLTVISGYGHDCLGSWERGDTSPSLLRLVDWAELLGFELTLKRKTKDEANKGSNATAEGSE